MSPAAASAVRDASPPGRRATVGIEDLLILGAGALAFAIALLTAAAHVSLRLNPRIVLFVAFDALLVVYLSVALTVLQRHRRAGALLALLLGNGLLAASCIKTAVLGEAGQFADLLLLPDLLRISDPLLAAVGIGGAALPVLGWLVNFGLPRSAREVALLLPLAGVALVCVGVLLSPAIAHAAAGTVPVKGRGFPVFGHFYTAYSSFIRDADWAHTVRRLRAEARLSPGFATLRRADLRAVAPRNLHILMIESLSDPAWYPNFGLEGLRLPGLFERWREGPRSTAFSPVFGNRSSNAEFEILCGVPAAVGPSDVIFWRLPEGPLPCLPERLAGLGYRSTALHPSPPRTFNLGAAYPALGFESAAFASDLDMSDRDGQFLSAASTLEQHWQRVRPLLDGDAPVLSYAFLNATHFPYQRDLRRRPNRLRPDGASPLVTGYLNAIYDATEAIDRFVERLLAADPDSLIVVVGDHAPALGANFAGHRAGGRIAPDEPDPLARATMYEVPLIMLDRGRLLSPGRLPIYLIPYVLLERLGHRARCDDDRCPWERPWRLRPFRDRALVVGGDDHGERLCLAAQPTAACREPLAELRAWQVELLELIEGPAGGSRPQTS